MQKTFKVIRVGESCGMEGENEIEVTCEFGVMRDVYGTGDSPSEWFCDPVKVTIDGFDYSWEELTDLEQEEIEHQANVEYVTTQAEMAEYEYEAWLEDQERKREALL